MALHMMVSRYLLPALVLGNGPTQSMIASQKGSPQTGMGLRGATEIGLFGLPTTWHV